MAMESLGELGRWISENESLLSGMASLIVVAGLVLSPLGKGARRLFTGRQGSAPNASPPSTPAAATTPDRARDPGEPLLAVLAFDNLSNDPEMQFFSDGVSDEILQRVSHAARLKVIARTSSFQLRGEAKALAAERLACSHVLDGSIRRAGERVRISAHLMEASSSTTLWSERYDRELADIFAVQDEISDEIASALDRTLSAPASERAVDAAAYDLYLGARPQSFAPDELRGAIDRLEEATRRAPDFAAAWGRLAYLRTWWHFYRPFAERPALASQVRREAERALARDVNDTEAITGLVFVVPPFGHFAEQHAAFERLVRTPGSGEGRMYAS